MFFHPIFTVYIVGPSITCPGLLFQGLCCWWSTHAGRGLDNSPSKKMGWVYGVYGIPKHLRLRLWLWALDFHNTSLMPWQIAAFGAFGSSDIPPSTGSSWICPVGSIRTMGAGRYWHRWEEVLVTKNHQKAPKPKIASIQPIQLTGLWPF